ncbi:hypothetical protein SLS56_006318 [Neofusicoccum ribis]|uniref:Uncharacterized protein n=1 Tax=Neofusicoccum ribis TaxID=45134 RepID=A0ABR3SR37_9PEZI
MHATGLFTALLLGASSASAAAVLDTRIPSVQTSVTLFDGTGGASSNTTSSGTSQTFSVNVGNCFSFSGESIDRIASSISVPAGYKCVLFDNFQCTGNGSAGIYSPGINELDDINYNDRARAIRCARPNN